MPYVNICNVPHYYALSTPTDTDCETIAFVHGWLLSERYWEPVAQSLASNYRTLRYDLRGFGRSSQQAHQYASPSTLKEQPFPQYSLASYAHDLSILLGSLNISSAWLVGHSLGGSIALWAASLFPEKIRGVICVNAGGGVYLPEEFERFRNAGEQMVRWRPSWLRYMPLLDQVFSRLMVSDPLAVQWGQQRLIDFLAAHSDAARGALLASTTESEVHRLPQVVAHLSQPVHFIAGAEDKVMEEQYVRHLASFHPLFKQPDSNITVLPNCGHMAMLEAPEFLAAFVHEWIDTQQRAYGVQTAQTDSAASPEASCFSQGN